MWSIDLSAEAAAWLKAGHIISVIAWMAGLLYLPRLFVYHTQCDSGSQQSETFKIMERRLMRAIMNPAMLASLAFGIPLVLNQPPSVWQEAWLYLKLACVAGLIINHMVMGSWRRAFAEDRNTRPQSFFRAMNEVPTVLMIAIVLLVVLKPF